MERHLTTTSIWQWVPIVKVVIFCGGITICLLIAYANGSVSAYIPFIRETGANIPESILFSLTLYLGAAAGGVTILYNFLIIRYQLHLMDKYLNMLNRVSTIFGLIAMIGLVGVAAVPMSTVLWVHFLFAVVYIFFALMYVNLQTSITDFIPGSNTTLNKIRDAFCFISMIFMVLLLYFFPSSYFKWRQVNHLVPSALKTPNDPYFGLMLTCSVFEWLVYASHLIVISSFYFEFRNFELVYGIVPRQNGAPATTEE